MSGADLAAELVAAASARGLTLATAESLTAGLVAARIADVPGASAVLLGGIVAYAAPVKAALLGVDPGLLGDVVTEPVAVAMAEGARNATGADLALATTGVAGPAALDGHEPGTAWIAVAGPGPAVRTQLLACPGDRADVRAGTVQAALALALAAVSGDPRGGE